VAANTKKRVIAALAAAQLLLLASLLWFWLARPGGTPQAGNPASAAAADDVEEFGTEDVDDPRPQKLPESHVVINGRKIVVEIARTAAQREKGLMYRKKLADDRAMIFIYPQARTDTAYWNRNVPMGLDLLFVSPDGKINHTAQMKPRDETTVGTRNPTLWVLEFPVGYVAKHKIKVGDRVEMPEMLKSIRGE
jgi:uncharacterized membrane protein (UPF0127 family)